MALILIKFGTNNPAERFKLANASSDDDVVLIQNGIYWALNDAKQYTAARVYAIKEDFLARGYDEPDSKVPLINYAQFVELIEKHPKTIS
ncbi:MAG TPA: sulfurtransferase complex subunit TusB [Pseudothermotoga sp.]|nr:sulfurtransferase complex subunit TusB [Pseudothermotoga sp.]HOK83671.1 sulfurtransferase complex subunit TusB [Pseudothermotoga sp.]HPP69310.1 sulfurtransferase complex subunit TusB [Pseudothermotoga sp.]